MKKTRFLLIVVLILPLVMISPTTISTPEGITALTNGDFESWTSGDADGWTKDTGLEDDEVSNPVHGGSAACSLTLNTTNTVSLKQVDTGVAVGHLYRFSFWTIDNDPAAQFRLYGYFRDSGSANIYPAVYTGYTVDNPAWQEYSVSAVAPVGTAEFLFDLRFYDVSANWDGDAVFTLDDVKIEDLGNAPPVIEKQSHRPWTPSAGETVTFRANVTDINSLSSVQAIVSTDDFTTNNTITMTDPESDGMYNCTYTAPSTGSTVVYAINATDTLGASSIIQHQYMSFVVMDAYPFISEFYVSGDDEYVVISNPSSSDIDISGWIITDEGDFNLDYLYDTAFAFPTSSIIPANDYIVIANNGLDFFDTFGKAPDYAHKNGTEVGAINTIQVAGMPYDFDLYTNYDEVILRSPNAVIDAVPYYASGSYHPLFEGDSFLTELPYTGGMVASASADTDNPAADFTMIDFGTGLVSPSFKIETILLEETVVAVDATVAIAVKLNWADDNPVNGTDYPLINVTYNVPAIGTDNIKLVYDQISGYYNGTIDFSGYTPSKDQYGFYHTTEIKINVAGGEYGATTRNTGILINPGYTAAHSVMLIDEAHDQMYAFTVGDYPNAPWATMLVTAGIIDYVMVLDLYNFHFRINNDVLTDIDLVVITGPDANPDTPHDASNALQTSEITAILNYVESGGSLWLSEVGAAYSIPDENGIGALTANWGLEWFRGYYQDPSHNLGQNNYCVIPIAPAGGTAFDNFNAFGAVEYYHNGMIVNKSVDVPGVTVTEVIKPTLTSNWDDIDDEDYDPNMNPITDIYSIAYVIENGTGKAFVTGSSSLFGHYYDFRDGLESAQFAFNVFCYLLGINPVQFPTLILTDVIGPQTVTTEDSDVTFTVALTSSLSGATLYNVEVEGLIEGDLVEFTAVGDGTYTGTWDATYSDAGTYKLEVTATAENMYEATYIDGELEITIVVNEPSVSTTTTTTKKASTPGFELISVLTMLSILGLAYTYIRKRR